jgi:N-dimethylarginine dimethylaminohydrolase
MFGLGRNADRQRTDVEAEVARRQGYGGQSMVAPLRRAIVQAPALPASDDDYRRYGYTHPVDHGRAVEEHAALCDLLRREGVEVIVQAADEAGRLDSIFVYDTSIVTDEGVVLANPGKELRRHELTRAAAFYDELDVPIIGHIELPGILEGGDTMWLDENTLVVGRGYRTNALGIEQLHIYCQPFKIDVLQVALPHWHGPEECLHLLSLISPVDERKAVVHSPLMSVDFVQLLHDLDWTLIEIPDEEFLTQGTNALAIAPGKVLLLRENIGTRRLLEAAGLEVLVYTGDEISHNRQGGPTCLTKPLLRDISAHRE